ncbi:hypothetical protein BD324DRAFT_310051 [Kockovaella imperatae]|uniref:Uncharacterized protein n=1 Tax=Kockovaella imperatae TaxID=4999 RepID=A0A1Y1UM14_9TREE|nr:hypothetical protein BD324DRAFT_310051 [Kockovaella imperatae]ORX39083.1 hypothetical protein BD324DRAFT_310051 [Kockovaella imperatae]
MDWAGPNLQIMSDRRGSKGVRERLNIHSMKRIQSHSPVLPLFLGEEGTIDLCFTCSLAAHDLVLSPSLASISCDSAHLGPPSRIPSQEHIWPLLSQGFVRLFTLSHHEPSHHHSPPRFQLVSPHHLHTDLDQGPHQSERSHFSCMYRWRSSSRSTLRTWQSWLLPRHGQEGMCRSRFDGLPFGRPQAFFRQDVM